MLIKLSWLCSFSQKTVHIIPALTVKDCGRACRNVDDVDRGLVMQCAQPA